MSRKVYWGFAALILLLIAAAGFIYWQWSEVAQLKEELAQDEEILEDKNKPITKNDLPPLRPADPQKQPPPGESSETGHWDGDHWHRTAPLPKSPQTPKATADGVVHIPGTLIGNKAFWDKYWKDRGLEPPDGDWTWATDGKGNYYKSYKGQFTPFEIKTKIGYAPTLEQYQRMQKLHAEWHRAKNKGNTAAVQRLEAEMATLREASQGELPTYAGGVYKGRVGESPEEARRNSRIQRAAVLRQLYREYGLEHLMPLTE